MWQVIFLSCYNPMAGFPVIEDGKTRYKIECKYRPEFKTLYPGVMRIPCGKCIGCRLDYSRNWADRMVYELISNDGKGIFLTLTYNEDHVPFYPHCDENGEIDGVAGYTLCKRDFQLFMKRLRKRFNDRVIRFYGAGEYGSKRRRPHYHVILFGLEFSDFTPLRQVGFNELGQTYYTSDLMQDIWSVRGEPIGFVCMSEVSYKTCAYVSRYTMKKAYDFEILDGQEPEFTLMSRRPGIGSNYFDEHPEIVDKRNAFVSLGNSSVKLGLPDYFLGKLKLTDPEKFDTIVSERRALASDQEILKLKETDLDYSEYLDLEERQKFNKTQILFNLREEAIL